MRSIGTYTDSMTRFAKIKAIFSMSFSSELVINSSVTEPIKFR